MDNQWTELDEIKSLPRATLNIKGQTVLVHVFPNLVHNPATDAPGKRTFVLSSEQTLGAQSMLSELPATLSIDDTNIYVMVTAEKVLNYA